MLLASGVIALSVLGAGCGAGSSSDGPAVATIYVSNPLSGGGGLEPGSDAENGARLALIDAGAKFQDGEVMGLGIGGAELRVKFLDDSKQDRSFGFDQVRTAANARMASEDSTSVAYIGELDSGATRVSLPITNQAGILQVSPFSGATDLVRAELFNDDVPTEFQTTGKRTFARLIPSDEQQGAAAARLLQRAPGSGSLIIGDGSSFATDLISGFQEVLPNAREVSTGEGPGSGGSGNQSGVTPGGDCGQALDSVAAIENARNVGRPIAKPRIFLAAEPACAGLVVKAIGSAQINPTLVLSSLSASGPTSSAIDSTGGAAYLTAFPSVSELPAKGQEMLSVYRKQFQSKPSTAAAYGYEAMASVLAALGRSGDPTDRDSVASAYFDGSERDSVIGRYSIDALGETSLDKFSAYQVTAKGDIKTLDPLSGRP